MSITIWNFSFKNYIELNNKDEETTNKNQTHQKHGAGHSNQCKLPGMKHPWMNKNNTKKNKKHFTNGSKWRLQTSAATTTTTKLTE